MIINPPLTIKETHRSLIKKDFSIEELVKSYIKRIKKYDRDINSFITVCENYALEKARFYDRLINKNTKHSFIKYPLIGVVVSHKDMFLTKGIVTTAASKVLEEYIPPYSATAVERINSEGAIIIGKTNCDAWAHGSSGENSDYGPTKNPWNLEYVPGGSSSGSAASVASNFCLVSTGTDTCGSIRLPANYCGIFGLKPTYGLVSRYGVIAMASSLDTVGNFGRCIEDVKLINKVVRGIDGHDSTLKDDININKIIRKKLKIGIPKEFFKGGITNDIVKNINEVIKIFKNEGIEFIEVSLPHTHYGISAYYIIQPAEVSSNLGRYDGIRYGAKRDSFSDEAKRRIMLGSYVLSSGYYDAYYLKAMKVRTIIRKEVNSAFNKVDALIAPVAPTPPFKLGEKVDDPLKMYLTDIYAATANLCGIPSLAVPHGFNKENLPLGFQLMGPRFGENILFKLGEIFEKASGYKAKTCKI